MSCCICSLPARGALCGHCAADPDATARHICDVLALCEQTHTRLLAELSADDTRRFLNVKRARRAAAAKGTLDTFNGRHAEAMARGDALADMLSADATLNDTRAWAERAQAELEALAVTL